MYHNTNSPQKIFFLLILILAIAEVAISQKEVSVILVDSLNVVASNLVYGGVRFLETIVLCGS